MKTYSVTVLALLSIACATTARTSPDPATARAVALTLLERGALIARGPTSLVLVRDGDRWGILKDHSS